jgi:hypothetical protein
MREGSRRAALDKMMDLSHVVLMTQVGALQAAWLPGRPAAWLLGCWAHASQLQGLQPQPLGLLGWMGPL